jgi:lipopolysaccharide biosynthesis glycosyltransferase
VLDDIANLWEKELGGAIIGATRDYVLPYFRARDGELPTYIHGRKEGTEHYSNAGVMLIDLEKWRQHDVTERSIEYLERLDEPATFLDQDALNVMCREHWHPISYAWNVWPDVKVAPEECSLFQAEPEQIEAMRSTEASIVHFAGDRKPRVYEDRDMPYASEYLRASGWFSVLGYRAWVADRAAHYYARTGRMALGRWRQNVTRTLSSGE